MYTVCIKNKFYFIGGAKKTMRHSVDIFDMRTQIWTKGTPAPRPLIKHNYHTSCHTDNYKIIICDEGLNALLIYYIQEDTWHRYSLGRTHLTLTIMKLNTMEPYFIRMHRDTSEDSIEENSEDNIEENSEDSIEENSQNIVRVCTQVALYKSDSTNSCEEDDITCNCKVVSSSFARNYILNNNDHVNTSICTHFALQQYSDAFIFLSDKSEIPEKYTFPIYPKFHIHQTETTQCIEWQRSRYDHALFTPLIIPDDLYAT